MFVFILEYFIVRPAYARRDLKHQNQDQAHSSLSIDVVVAALSCPLPLVSSLNLLRVIVPWLSLLCEPRTLCVA